MSIKAVNCIESWELLLATKGGYRFYSNADGNDRAGFHFNCPGCGEHIYGVDSKIWTINGPDDCLTLGSANESGLSSVRAIGNCGFHGHLVNGEWTFCDDSGCKERA